MSKDDHEDDLKVTPEAPKLVKNLVWVKLYGSRFIRAMWSTISGRLLLLVLAGAVALSAWPWVVPFLERNESLAPSEGTIQHLELPARTNSFAALLDWIYDGRTYQDERYNFAANNVDGRELPASGWLAHALTQGQAVDSPQNLRDNARLFREEEYNAGIVLLFDKDDCQTAAATGAVLITGTIAAVRLLVSDDRSDARVIVRGRARPVTSRPWLIDWLMQLLGFGACP